MQHWPHDPRRDIALLAREFGGAPALERDHEVRWNSETSQGRFIYYPARGIVYDTKHPGGKGIWNFLEQRGWSRRDLHTEFFPEGGSGPGRVVLPAGGRQMAPAAPFTPPADRASANLEPWQTRWIERALRAPRVPYGSPAWMWACGRGGDKWGAWPARRQFPSSLRWMATGSGGGGPMVGFVVSLMYPLQAWREAWKSGRPDPRPETCLAVHRIAVGGMGQRAEDWKGRHKLTIGAKRGCLAAIGGESGVTGACVVEGVADALAVHQHCGPGAVTLTSAGLDIAGRSHRQTHRWLAGLQRVVLLSDGDAGGDREFGAMRDRIARHGGNARVVGDREGSGDPWDRYRRIPSVQSPRRGAGRSR